MSILIATAGVELQGVGGAVLSAGTCASEFLPAYARAFRGVEADSAFYAIPMRGKCAPWAERTPPEFTFALKMPKELRTSAAARRGRRRPRFSRSRRSAEIEARPDPAADGS